MTTIAAPEKRKNEAVQLGPQQQNRRARRQEKRAKRRAANGQPDVPVDPNAPPPPPTLDETNKGWAQAVLGGNFGEGGANVPMFDELTDPAKSDPTTNPYIQSMIESLKGQVKEDWLGNRAAAAEQADASGSGLGSAYFAQRTRADEEASDALASNIAQMYSGAYENERNRRAGLFNSLLGAQQGASGIPLQYKQLAQDYELGKGQLGVARAGIGVQRGQLGLARQEFAFNKQMSLAAAQQDALNDYFGLLSGIGGMGGTQQGSGQYIPTTNPYAAGLLGAAGGAMQGYAFGKTYGSGSGSQGGM